MYCCYMSLLAFILSTLFLDPIHSDLTIHSTVDVSGVVVEEVSGDPLAGVSVRITGFEEIYYTDFEGRFNIEKLESGKYDIAIDYISFDSKILNSVQLDQENSHLFISLK